MPVQPARASNTACMGVGPDPVASLPEAQRDAAAL